MRLEDFVHWVVRGTEVGASHLFVVLDQYEQIYYNVYIFGEDLMRDAIGDIDGVCMQEVVAIFSLSQCASRSAFCA